MITSPILIALTLLGCGHRFTSQMTVDEKSKKVKVNSSHATSAIKIANELGNKYENWRVKLKRDMEILVRKESSQRSRLDDMSTTKR